MYNSFNVTLTSLPVAGFVRRGLLWCFESRARAVIFIDEKTSQFMSQVQLKNEIMNSNLGDHVTSV